MRIEIYKSYCKWPISVHRLKDGWLVNFFALTCIFDKSRLFK